MVPAARRSGRAVSARSPAVAQLVVTRERPSRQGGHSRAVATKRERGEERRERKKRKKEDDMWVHLGKLTFQNMIFVFGAGAVISAKHISSTPN
jgi:hypothetical protein